jgi:hypothetical protein
MTLEQFIVSKPMHIICGIGSVLSGLYAVFVEPKVVQKKLARREPFVTDKNLPFMSRLGKIAIACGIVILICTAFE